MLYFKAPLVKIFLQTVKLIVLVLVYNLQFGDKFVFCHSVILEFKSYSDAFIEDGFLIIVK